MIHDADPDKPVRSVPYPEVPAGRCSFELMLGGVLVRVEELPTAWSPYVDEELWQFAAPVDRAATPQLTLTCRFEPRAIVVPLDYPGAPTRIAIERTTGTRFTLRSHWQDGWFDLAAGVGELIFASRDWIRFRMSLENALRVIFQLALVERRQFLMHSAAVVDRQRAFLFFGHSGAGKSTATRYSLPRPALSDDMVLIDLRGERPFAEAVPFHGTMPREARHRGRYPVAAALRLRQAPEDRIETISAARAIATVGASVPFVHELGVAHDGLTALIAALCHTVPIADLHFTKSARFWTVLDAAYPE